MVYIRAFWGIKIPWDNTFFSYLLSLIKALIKSYFINGPGPEARINKILICATLGLPYGIFCLVSANFPDLPPNGMKSGINPVNPGIYRVNRN